MAGLYLATGIVDYLAGELPWWGVIFWARSDGVLAAFGGRVTPAVAAGQTWRLLSNVFLHGSPLHLGFNLFALWILGRIGETLYGPARFLALFLIAGLSGSLLSNAVGAELSVGASGALFGLMGAAIVFGWRRRGVLSSELRRYFGRVMIAATLLNLGLGLLLPWIDNAAHLGGVLGGIGCGALLEDYIVPSKAPRSRPAVFMFLLSTVSLVWMGSHMTQSVLMNLSALLSL